MASNIHCKHITQSSLLSTTQPSPDQLAPASPSPLTVPTHLESVLQRQRQDAHSRGHRVAAAHPVPEAKSVLREEQAGGRGVSGESREQAGRGAAVRRWAKTGGRRPVGSQAEAQVAAACTAAGRGGGPTGPGPAHAPPCFACRAHPPTPLPPGSTCGSMPNSSTSLRFVDTATMCLATASWPSSVVSQVLQQRGAGATRGWG